MKVYLAWSGDTSRRLAEAFQSWLPRVLQHIHLFYSPSDIDKGTRWASVISSQLETCNAGLLFITPDNLDSRWIHFEAGALSKAVDNSRVTPILFGLESSQLSFPLAQFQNSQFSKDDMLKLLHDYNNLTESKIANSVLDDVFNAFWPKLEDEVKTIILEADTPQAEPEAKPEETLLEILDIVRYTAKQVQNLNSRQVAIHQNMKGTYSAGQKVRHATFGVGVILNVIQDPEKPLQNTQLEVAFPKVGVKKLLLAYAKLEPVIDTDITPIIAADDLDEADPFADE